MAGEVWAIAEQRDGKLRKVSFEAMSAAKKLADELGVAAAGVVVGSGVGDLAAEMAKYGAAKVYVADDAKLAAYTSNPYAQVIADLAKAEKPQIILLGASVNGRDLSNRLSAKLGVSIMPDCTAAEIKDGRLVMTRPVFAGKAFGQVRSTGEYQIATLRPNVFDAVESAGAGEVVAAPVGLDDASLNTTIKEFMADAAGKVDLTEAEIIVSGGRGMKDAENFQVIEKLADMLGATVGASRAAVDAGWRPHADQVGQTGKVVTPNLYIACGISGAIQHLAGMGSSKVICAINKDPDAPIFQKADFGVVGDLFDVVPALAAAVDKMKSEG
jgi:electron transfer flavoprotein alpha subunit